MKLEITPKTTLQEIKSAFHTHYPGLKIEFFIDKNQDGNYTSDERVQDYNSGIAILGATKTTGTVSIEPEATVAKIEGVFANDFGVIAQVFRKRGNAWLMTSATDTQTLAKLNESATESIDNTQPDITNAADRQELE